MTAEGKGAVGGVCSQVSPKKLAAVEREIQVDHAVRLRLQGMRFHQIGEELGVSTETAAAYVKRGLQALRKQYREGREATIRRASELLVGFDELQRQTMELLKEAKEVPQKIQVLTLAKGILTAKAKALQDLGLVRPFAEPATPPSQMTVQSYNAYVGLLPDAARRLAAQRMIDEHLEDLPAPEPYTP